MSRNYKFHCQNSPYFISFATVYWMDVFTRPVYRDILVNSIMYCIREKGLIVYSWVIMSNHVHMIIGTREMKMQDILRDLKKYSSKKIIEKIKDNPRESRRHWMLNMFEEAGRSNSNNHKYQFWQQNNHPIELFSERIIQQKINYLHENPVKQGWVNESHEYKYSSAIDYAGRKGMIDIVKLL